MPLEINQHDQFTVLTNHDITINHASIKHRHLNIVIAKEAPDALLLIETTPFDLILLEWSKNHSALITQIKDPACVNHKTPIIALVNVGSDHALQQPPVYNGQRSVIYDSTQYITNLKDDSGEENQYQISFDGWLISPLTEEHLYEVIAIWRSETLAYIQTILNKTKNNQRLALTIFEKLFEELPLQINHIKHALKNEHYDVAKEITHKLHGSVSFCGLSAIQASAHALESNLLGNDYRDTGQLFVMLQQHVLNFTRHQQSILANFGKS